MLKHERPALILYTTEDGKSRIQLHMEDEIVQRIGLEYEMTNKVFRITISPEKQNENQRHNHSELSPAGKR